MHAAVLGSDGVTAIEYKDGAVIVSKDGAPYVVVTSFGCGVVKQLELKPKKQLGAQEVKQ